MSGTDGTRYLSLEDSYNLYFNFPGDAMFMSFDTKYSDDVCPSMFLWLPTVLNCDTLHSMMQSDL